MTTKHILTPIVALMVLIVASCTLMDNDLRNLPDKPGYDAVEHVETDDYTLDYQYQPTTIAVDDEMDQYISAVDYEQEVMYMYDYTPDDLLPDVGRVVVSGITEHVTYGLRHRVTEVTRDGNLYALKLEQATLDAAYKHLRLDAHFGSDTADVANAVNDMDENDARSLTRAATDGAQNFKYGEWHEFSLLDKISAMTAIVGVPIPNHVKFDTKDKRNLGVKGYADVQGDIVVAWRPIIQGHALVDIGDRVVDMDVKVGVENKTTVSVTGKLGVNIDIFDLFGVKELLSIKEPIVPVLDLWLTGGLTVEIDLNVSGTVSKTFHRKSYLTLEACNNIEGKADGVSVDKSGGAMEVTDKPEDESWSDPAQASPDFEVALMAGTEIKLLIGNPIKWPQAGIAFAGLIGPKIKTIHKGGSLDPYDHMLQAGVAVKASGRFYFDLFENITFDWDFVDALFKLLGSDTGAEVMIPGASTERRFYPDMQNTSITCQNTMDTDEPPRFDFSFDVTNRGFFCSESSRLYPHFIVYEKGDDTPLLEYQPTNVVTPAGSGVTLHDHFEWNGLGDGVLKRDTEYEMEVNMMSKPGIQQPFVLWTKRIPFVAAFRPTIISWDGSAIAQYHWVPASDEDIAAGAYEHYDWTFDELFTFDEPIPIMAWGFDIGKDRFEVQGSPTNGQSNVRARRVIWKLKNSRKDHRSLVVKPFAYARDPRTGEVERYEQKAFSVHLKWSPMEWWQVDWENEPRTVNGLNYLLSGCDWEEHYAQDDDINIYEQGSLGARRHAPIGGDDGGAVTFVVDLDDTE